MLVAPEARDRLYLGPSSLAGRRAQDFGWPRPLSCGTVVPGVTGCHGKPEVSPMKPGAVKPGLRKAGLLKRSAVLYFPPALHRFIMETLLKIGCLRGSELLLQAVIENDLFTRVARTDRLVVHEVQSGSDYPRRCLLPCRDASCTA